MIAVKFNNFNPGDSLKGVKILFNQSFENANLKYFQIAVWENDGGLPGNMIHLEEGFRPDFETGLNGFSYFEFDSLAIVGSTYFIGIRKVTSDFLNIGFDRNTNHQEDIFYLISSEWKNTSFEGSLMIRPVFANKSMKTGIEEQEIKALESNIRIFPNPVIDQLNFQFPEGYSEFFLKIMNQHGQLIKSSELQSDQYSVSDLAKGTYFIILEKKDLRISKRFIKL